ncbi:MAG: branched-chain amino acid ABC transporter permease [Parvibaculaceae bacterium]
MRRTVIAAALILASATPAAAQEASAGYVVQQGLNCAMVAALYCPLAAAYALVHGVTNRIVLSFGDFAMFGAFYTVYAVLFLLSGGVALLAALGVVFAVALLGTAALGLASYRTAFAPVLGARSQALMIVSVGLSIILQEVMRVQSGGREQWLSPVATKPVASGVIDGYAVSVTIQNIAFPAMAALLCLGLIVALARTPFGRAWRACCQDRGLAALSGLNVDRVVAASMAISAALAAAAGYIIAVNYGGVSFYMGLVLGLKALFATIIGGTGSIPGAVLGGFLLAAFETGWTSVFSSEYRDVAVFGVVVLVFILRPGGLLGVAIREDSEA